MTSAPAIGFEYRRSRHLKRVLLPVAALALLATWLNGLPFAAQGLLSVAVIAGARRALARIDRSPVAAVGLSRDGTWSLRLQGGEDVGASLISARVVTERYISLLLRAPGLGAVPLLLAPDNSDADIRRRLRMRLAIAAVQAGSKGTLAPERGPTV